MIDRRQFLVSSAIGGAALAGGGALWAGQKTPQEAQLDALFAGIFDELLQVSPQSATFLGIDHGKRADLKARLQDSSYANRLGNFTVYAGALPRLRAFDRTGLSERALTQLDTLIWLGEACKPMAAVPWGGHGGFGYPVPYVISQLSGAYSSVPALLIDRHGVANKADAEAYLARLTAFAKNVQDECDRAEADAARGVIPPAFLLDKTLAQTRSLREQQGEASRLAIALAQKARGANIGDGWGARAAAIVDGPLATALDRQIAVLTRLRAKATDAAGVGRLPDGARFYANCLHYHTTTNLTPDEAHRIGLEQVAALTAQADTLLRAQGLSQGTVGERLTALGRDPRYLYPDSDAGREAIINDLQARIGTMRERMPAYFSAKPKSEMIVRRVPVETQLGSPGAYASGGKADGSTPGTFFINLADMKQWPKWALPTLLHHEAVPGHLWEGAISDQMGGAPELFLLLGFPAYGEGWGLYAEQLADEIGVYENDPLGRFGYLQSFLFRAARIVIDTGLHAKGWSRKQAIDYMMATSGNSYGEAEREVDRYIAWPGQACSYKLGHTEIVRQREAARAKLGAKFDLKAYHDHVVLGGPMPLEILGRSVDSWAQARLRG